MSLNLADLISKCGDDVQFQNLDQCTKMIDFHHKKGTTITFGTTAGIGPNGMEKLGLIVWLDRDQVAQIVKASKENSDV